jgi:hypothetical protein
MKLVRRVFLVGLVSLNVTVAFQGASASAATTISVATYGAKCNGTTNDTAAIQSALDAASAAGGGTVTLPGSTCLLNSFRPSSHPWRFYNLHISSGVMLQGVVGSSRLLQCPNGRQLIGKVPGATWIETSVVTFGNDYATVHYSHQPASRVVRNARASGEHSTGPC